METRKLVNVRRLFLAILTSSSLLFLPPLSVAYADDHGKVRMYKLNKKGQLLKQRWLKNAEVEGCHNTIRARQVHRFAQVGYKYCQLFSKEGCAQGSELFATWKGKRYRNADFDEKQPQVNIPRGTEWYLHDSENIEVRSWACYY